MLGIANLLKSSLKRVLYSVAPQTAAALMSARSRRHSQSMVKQWGLLDLNARLLENLGDRVLSGPFQGLTLSPMTRKEHLGPFLLGTYEAELHAWWEEIFNWSFSQIIDVGSKFGYYAVGLARHFPDAQVIAFDIDPWAKRATREMIAANRTPNVAVLGSCSPEWLQRELEPHALLVSDCEGYEKALFCGPQVPNLSTAVMLIELHEEVSPGVTSALEGRFIVTHHASRVAAHSDNPVAPVSLDFLSKSEAGMSTSEIRSPQEWMLFVPRSMEQPRST